MWKGILFLGLCILLPNFSHLHFSSEDLRSTEKALDDGGLPDESETLYQVTVVEFDNWRAACILGTGTVNQ